MANVTHFNLDGQIIDIPIPSPVTVNNGTLTIQKNGSNVGTFTANQSGNTTANITVPTKVSELTNDSGYTTNTGTVTQVKVGSTAYNPSSGVVSLPAYPTVPTVNNGTLTIQKNGSNVATFTANQSGNSTANITVPTVNNGTLTIQKNGSNVQTFTANQSSNATANITVPTKTSDLTNDDNWVLLATSTGSQVTFGSFIGSVYHTVLMVTEITISAGITFTFNDVLPVLSFPNTSTSRLLRTGYYDATNDYIVCQIQVSSSVLKLDAIFTSFTVTSKSTKLYVKK